MTGSNWTGAVHDWKAAPDQYGAIHFHDDDQGPLGWSDTASLSVPADWPSGFYAAHISNEAGEDFIPFIVRPRQPQADVVLLVPTFSYQVYGSYRPPRPRRGNRRTRRRMGIAAADAGHEPAVRAVLLQSSQRWVRRVAGHSIPSDAGYQAAAVFADGPGRGRIRHRALGGGQLHRPVPDHHRRGARRHHRSRPARRGCRRAGALSRRHRRAASGIPLRAHDAGVRGFPRRGRTADVSRRQRLLLARRTVRGSARHAGSASRRRRHPRVGNDAGRELSCVRRRLWWAVAAHRPLGPQARRHQLFDAGAASWVSLIVSSTASAIRALRS